MEPTATTAPALPRSIEEIRAEFPILARQIHGEPLAYLDNGATAQKPLAVIEALDAYWREHNANVHRGVHTLSEEATALYEEARATVASHLGADRREVVFVRNATEALNLVAYSWGRTNLQAGDRIVVTEMEHHSNVVPWYQVAQEKGAHLDWAPIDGDGRLDLDAFAALLEQGPKLVCVAHVSNVLGTINPIEEIARMAHDAGALLVVDGAQAGPKLELDMAALGADFYAVTAHKMYGPTGIGALFGRRELLEEMPPFIGGGSMIRKVTKELITWADLPAKFEGGTPPIGEAVGFGAAVRWIDELGLPAIHAAEAELTAYALERVAEVPGPHRLRPARRGRPRRHRLLRHGGRPRPRRLGDPRPPRRRRQGRPPLRPGPDAAARASRRPPARASPSTTRAPRSTAWSRRCSTSGGSSSS